MAAGNGSHQCHGLQQPSQNRGLVSVASSSPAPSPRADLPPCPVCQSLCTVSPPARDRSGWGLSASFPSVGSAHPSQAKLQESSPRPGEGTISPCLLLTEEELPRSVRSPHEVGPSIPLNKILCQNENQTQAQYKLGAISK